MIRHLSSCLVIASLLVAAPRSAPAAVVDHVFDTVDTVEINHDPGCAPSSGCGPAARVVVTGIRQNTSVQVTEEFIFYSDTDMAARCERLALIAIAKPGKYRFAIGSHTNGSFNSTFGGGCRLVVRDA